MARWLADFCWNRFVAVQDVSPFRTRRYGDGSWQWRWTFWQQKFWYKLHKRARAGVAE